MSNMHAHYSFFFCFFLGFLVGAYNQIDRKFGVDGENFG